MLSPYQKDCFTRPMGSAVVMGSIFSAVDAARGERITPRSVGKKNVIYVDVCPNILHMEKLSDYQIFSKKLMKCLYRYCAIQFHIDEFLYAHDLTIQSTKHRIWHSSTHTTQCNAQWKQYTVDNLHCTME